MRFQQLATSSEHTKHSCRSEKCFIFAVIVGEEQKKNSIKKKGYERLITLVFEKKKGGNFSTNYNQLSCFHIVHESSSPWQLLIL